MCDKLGEQNGPETHPLGTLELKLVTEPNANHGMKALGISGRSHRVQVPKKKSLQKKNRAS